MSGTPNLRRVATIGTFDGLHKGHRRVIFFMKELARQRGLEPLVITFNRHPRSVVDPVNSPALIMQPSDRSIMLEQWGVTELKLNFTPEMSALKAEEWLCEIHEKEGVDLLVLGYDNKFGSDGNRYSPEDYQKLGASIGLEIVTAPVEEGVSSTFIRHRVKEGKIEEANRLLGHPFVLSGKVVEGKNMGSNLGYPTANIQPAPDALIPKPGVYAAEVELPEGRIGKGAVNIGYQPTVTETAPLRIETHILDYNGNLYGRTLRLNFLAHLRDEIKFDSIEDLKKQIKLDTIAVANISTLSSKEPI